MKNYAFHLAQGDISIRIMRMAMVIGTIGKAEVNFMGVILQQIHQFCEGRIPHSAYEIGLYHHFAITLLFYRTVTEVFYLHRTPS